RYRRKTLQRIAAFWGFHSGLVGIAEEESFEEENSSLAGDLKNWTAEDHRLFVILKDGADVGFVHLHRIGPIVMQLWDLLVDDPMRGQGIATQAIALAEQDRKSTRLNSSHVSISYAVFCLKKKSKKAVSMNE